MRAMVVRKYGAPEVFEAREVPDPQPKAGEVLVETALGVDGVRVPVPGQFVA